MPRALSSRPPLSRDRLVDAALDLIDEGGVTALSMRKLGARLGVEAMTLYHYVPHKDALLDLVVERVTLRAAAAPAATPAAGWRERLSDFARGYRRVLLAHPRVLPLVSTRPIRSSEALGEFFQALSGLVGEGFAPRSAYFALQAVAMLVIGMAMAEAGEPAPGAEPAPDAPQEASYLEGLSALFPDAETFSRRHEAAFDFALGALLDGLDTRRGPG